MSDQLMQAVRVHDYGSPDVLKLEQTPLPEPGANQVLSEALGY